MTREDLSNFSWTQPCCESCWGEHHGGVPVQFKSDMRMDETCVYCGEPTRSGIYIRVDPKTAPHPTLTK
jgi:hypothetical protein